jgi:hypothetical protein
MFYTNTRSLSRENGIRGVYHVVSEKWLQGYLNEYAWRYNHRDDGHAQFKTCCAALALVRPACTCGSPQFARGGHN